MARTVVNQAGIDGRLHNLINKHLGDTTDCFNLTITINIDACYNDGTGCANGTLNHNINGCGDYFDVAGYINRLAGAAGGK